MRCLGASRVALVVSWAQDDVAATILAADSRTTVSDAVLGRVIDQAHDRGLEVLVFPIVTLRETAPGKWRGTLAPSDIDTWWRAYESFIEHYANIASKHATRALLVGSELGSTEGWRDRWFHLISRVEKRFDGELLYSANWDHYERVSFWSRLDAVGVTGYFELGDAATVSDAALLRTWRHHRDTLAAFSAKVGLPLVLTEVGYPSRKTALSRPWDYASTATVDERAQARGFAALAAAFDTPARLGGVYIWNWYPDGPGGYTPRGKRAEQVIGKWFVRLGAAANICP